MATIFLSYRRSDSPQACRVHEWLTRRFGEDEVFMDVSAIPAAVDFSDFIQGAIAGSRMMIVLIGKGWQERVQAPDDPVRQEIQAALDNQIPLLPVLVGNTPMPDPDQLPAAIAAVAKQNAVAVGVSHDFHTHMQTLLPRIESMLRLLSRPSRTLSDPDVIYCACDAIARYLKDQFLQESAMQWDVEWQIVGTSDFSQLNRLCVTLFLHRTVRLGELLELHIIFSIWGYQAINEQRLAGWVMRQLERAPVIPAGYIAPVHGQSGWDLKIRRSDEDPRQIWKMITDQPLRLSLAYVATISPRTDDGATATDGQGA